MSNPDLEHMRTRRLPNWGRWGRQDTSRPDPNRCGHSICVAFIPKGDEEGWGEEAPDLPPPAIDARDAEDLDGYIQQLAPEYRRAICRSYYKRLAVPRDDLDTAVRMLLDLVDANRATVERMYELLYRRSA